MTIDVNRAKAGHTTKNKKTIKKRLCQYAYKYICNAANEIAVLLLLLFSSLSFTTDIHEWDSFHFSWLCLQMRSERLFWICCRKEITSAQQHYNIKQFCRLAQCAAESKMSRKSLKNYCHFHYVCINIVQLAHSGSSMCSDFRVFMLFALSTV